jgi:hypothetical protein
MPRGNGFGSFELPEFELQEVDEIASGDAGLHQIDGRACAAIVERNVAIRQLAATRLGAYTY